VVDDSEESNVEAYLGNIRLPSKIADIFNEVYQAGNLQKLASVAPDKCNEFISTPASFATDWGKLQGFSIGGRKNKNKNKTRKK